MLYLDFTQSPLHTATGSSFLTSEVFNLRLTFLEQPHNYRVFVPVVTVGKYYLRGWLRIFALFFSSGRPASSSCQNVRFSFHFFIFVAWQAPERAAVYLE